MVKQEKEHGWTEVIKDVLGYLSRILSTTVLSPIVDSSETIMKNIDDRLLRIEKRLLQKISSLFIIMFGGIFLVFSLFFFLRDTIGWSTATVFFSIGITVFVMGLLLTINKIEK